MKSPILKTLTILLGILLLPSVLYAWCWIRDTGRTSAGCGSTSLYTANCCDGNLRTWSGATMPYHISSATPAGLIGFMQAGINLWNAIEMSAFTFDDQGTSPLTTVSYDGTNLISIDSSFATDNGFVGQGVLAVSTTWAQGSGTSYRALESDIVFNGEEFTWGDGTGGSFSTTAVVAHEAGHSAGLSHAGAECQNSGSEGCGTNFEEATMYWNYSAGATGLRNKGTLELDDVAALIHGYPTSTFSVKVVNSLGDPIPWATVELLDAAAPLDGNNRVEGGRVYGDVTNTTVLVGDKALSGSYINQTPFDPSDASGLTNAIHPTHRAIRIRTSIGGISQTVSHTLVDGTSILTVTLPVTETDLAAPLLSVTSHNPGETVNSNTITLSGTASDAERGESGIQQVLVNGILATDSSASNGDTAFWNAEVPLSSGTNTIAISASDDTAIHNECSQTIVIIHDNVPPDVARTSPSGNLSGVPLNSTVTVQFNEAMNPETLTGTTFMNDQGLSGTVTYDTASYSATFTPDAPLASHTTYTFALTTDVKDAAGNPLAAPETWSFSTQPPESSSGGGGGCFIQTMGQ